MASFKKRGKTWQYTVSRYVDGKYKPIRKSGFKTQKEAKIAAAEVEDKLRKGMVTNPKEILFSDYFESWLNTYKVDIGANTLARYRNTLATIQGAFEGVYLQNISRRTYQEFLNNYAKNRSKRTVRKLNSHIRASVKDAIDEGLIYSDFTRNAVFGGNEGKKSDDKFLNVEESNLLLNELTKRINESPVYYLLILGLTSGMRFGEMVGLTRKDFNFLHNTITINKTWGYTNKMHNGFGKTKNESSNRTIVMDKKTMKLFEDWFSTTPDNIQRLVFYSSLSKYKVISNGVANKLLKRTIESINENISDDEDKIKSISLHGLRHTHASLLLYQGVSVYYVSKRLGHADIETTVNTYIHLVKELEEKNHQITTDAFMKMYG